MLGALVPSAASAQSWPDKPIRFVMTAPAGSSIDVIGRTIADKLSDRLGQPFIVDNKPAAATAIAAEYVEAAPPDGHTLVMATVTTLALNPLTITPLLRYRADQFEPVALVIVTTAVQLLVASLTVSAERSEGAHCLCQGKSGEDQLGDTGPGRIVAAGGRTPEVARRHRHGRHPLQGQRAGQRRPCRARRR